MSFFTKACVQALQEIPEINAYIEGQDILYHDYCHIGIAVGTDKGLVVPVIRHAEKLSFAEIEQAIVDYVKRIRENRLSLSDLEGGTFTISNGGVYGSLLSTPILNTPQSGILGMHKLEDRPVVINGEIVIRTMMYVALSYDHRIVDGKGAVTFLKRVKEFIENPERMILEI
jgi:2-oxoglutarate dehydrogenase E2 component (dihydrolipoamide succinyltransferase)